VLENLKKILVVVLCCSVHFPVSSQQNNTDSSNYEIDLVSDTQAPIGVEKLVLKAHQNELATRKIFEDITERRPYALLMLGDVVSIGYKESKWTEMDDYLWALKTSSIAVSALMGNHDVMFYPHKGETNFLKRFPDQVNTGFYKVYDSIAFIMLNSNFKTLDEQQLRAQQTFYITTLQKFDSDNAIKCIVVCCHHAPYSNSTIVGVDKEVQENFVPAYLTTKKAKLFITGHAHDFERFEKEGKDFLTIGGGGGLHQPLNVGTDRIPSLTHGYDPEFHYLLIRRMQNELVIISRVLKPDFSGFENRYRFELPL
jgi:3',5'-cyclic AMP phosphodiesterase CpdA